MTLYGYGGNYLDVDLSSGKVSLKETPSDLVEKYIGGKWLATYLLHKYMSPKLDPFSPESIFIVATGPATGTKIPLASKIGFYFKSPLTNIYGESYMGGNFPAAFKWVGLDYIIIRGKSDSPVFLYVDDDEAKIEDASNLWGLNTLETEKKLEEDLGKDIEVAEIGPAGEKLIRYAVVSHGYGEKKRESKAGRTGAGAVMGSKGLKAIVIKTRNRRLNVFDEDGLREYVKKLSGMIASDPATGAQSYRKYGTPAALVAGQKMGFFPVRYWEFGQTGHYDKLDPDILVEKYYVHNVACYNCPFACGKYSVAREGIFKGLDTKGPEYETIFSFGGNSELADYDKLIAINVLCDRYGIDTIDAGNVIAFVLSAYENGKLELDRPVKFGDYESIMYLFEKIVKREGIGYAMGEGIKALGVELGLEDIAIHVKGLSLSAYDPRRLKGMALSYAIGTRGGGHLRTASYYYEFKGVFDADDIGESKVKYLVDREDLFSLHDSLVLCRFGRALYEWENTLELLRVVSGFDLDLMSLRNRANEVRTMIREFNIASGIDPEVDDLLPTWFFKKELKTYDGKVFSITEEQLKHMLRIYYKERGWNEKGYPS